MTKSLFLLVNNLWCPCFEIGLELMKKQMDEGNQVYAVACNKRQLPFCHSNINKCYEDCLRCNVRLDNGLKKINLPKKNVFEIKKYSKLFKYIPKEFKTKKDIKNVTINDINFGNPVLSTMISVFEDHEFDVVTSNDMIKRVFKMAILNFEAVLEVINKNKPDELYFLNGRTAESAAIIEYCEKKNITYYSYEVTSTLNKYMLRKNSIPHSLKVTIKEIEELWNKNGENKIEEAKQYFIDQRNGAEKGWVSFTDNQIKGSLPDGFDHSKTNIAIFNSSINEHETLPEWHNHIYENELMGLEKIFDDFKDNYQYHFYLRIHPNLKNKMNVTQMIELKRISENNYPNVTFIWPESLIDTYALMEASEKTLVFLSTMGTEATFWGKPSILAGRSFYQSLNCTYNPNTHQEVIDLLLEQNLKPKPLLEALKAAHWLGERGIYYKYYKPSSLFEGKFIDEQISGEISKKHRYLIRFNKNINQVKNLFITPKICLKKSNRL